MTLTFMQILKERRTQVHLEKSLSSEMSISSVEILFPLFCSFAQVLIHTCSAMKYFINFINLYNIYI